jgi:WD40 repeat protein
VADQADPTAKPDADAASASAAVPPDRYDLFLSYADADRPWAEGYLSDALTRAGVRYTSEAAFALGVPRIQAFEQALQQSRRTLLVLSPAYLADGFSQFTDILAQSYGLETATWPVIPLILQTVELLPPRLAMLERLDATDPASWEQVVARLCKEAQRPAPAPAPRPVCPFPGMVPFTEADSSRFFGRDVLVDDLLQRLRLHTFLTVIGPSGCGKSSLVFAGLVPALRASTLFGSGAWRVCTLRPGASPLAALTASLGTDPADPAKAVAAALAADPSAQRLLLVVDQFEELFTLGAQVGTSFAQAVERLADSPGCFVVLTMRADFYADLMISPLWPRVQAHRAEVVPLSADGLRQAIVRPAEDVGVFVETALVERLLADAASEPGVLPLVQETLVLLWEHLERRYLPLRAYEALVLPRSANDEGGPGTLTGLQVAMARRADAALADLSTTQQTIVRRIFLRLVQFGEGRADTRRQQQVDDLRAAGDDPALFNLTLAHLVDRRLLTLGGAESEAERTVDLAHESLITGWPTLHEWIGERRAAEQTRRRLEEKAEEWVRLGRGGGGLLDEAELPEAENWLTSPDAADLGKDEALVGLVQASRVAIDDASRQKAREVTRLRRLAAGLAGVLVVAIAAAIIAGLQTLNANSQQQKAQREANANATQVVISQQAEASAKHQAALALSALSRQLAAQAVNQLASPYDLALLLAVEANRLAATTVARESMLQALAYNPQAISSLYGHTNYVRSVVFSPDGRTLASGSYDDTIRLWDVQTHRQLGAPLTGHTGPVLSVAFSPDGRILASGSLDRSIRLWNVQTHRQLGAPLTGHTSIAESVAFSPDGRTLAAGNADGTIQLWHLRTHRTTTVLYGYAGPVYGVAFSPDGRTLASGSDDDTIRLWNVQTHRQLGAPLTGHTDSVSSVAFSPDGRILASGSLDRSIRLWNVQTHRQLGAPLTGHTDFVPSVAFSPDGRTLASGSDDGTIRLWDVLTHRQLGAPLTGHTDAVLSVAFSPDGRTLASGSSDHSIRLWNVLIHQQLGAPLTGHTSTVYSVAFSPDGRTLASASLDHSIRLWNVQTHRQLGVPLTGHTDAVLSVAFSPDGRTLASSSDDGTIRLWDVQTHRQLGAPLTGHTDFVRSVVFSPDGRTLASGSLDHSIRLWDVVTHRQLGAPLTGHTGPVLSVAFSPDGWTLASASWDATIRLWDVATNQQIGAPLTGHTSIVESVAFTPDGRSVASGSDDDTIRLWDMQTYLQLGVPLTGHTGPVLSVAFSPDGRTLASGSWDATIRLWDVATHQQIGAPLTGHTSYVRSVAFSPDGRTLASGSDDGTIRLWDVGTLHGSITTLEQRACSIANRNLTRQEWEQYIPGLPYPASQKDQICPGIATT